MITFEKEIEKRFCKWIEDTGGMAVKFTDPVTRGAPDRIIFDGIDIDGSPVVYFVEFKRPKGVIAQHQKEYAKMLNEQGLDVYLIDSLGALKIFQNECFAEQLLLLDAL